MKAIGLFLSLLLAGCAATKPQEAPFPAASTGEEVVGLHILSFTSDSLLVELAGAVPELAEQGVNLIVLEVDYSFEFQSHPELRQGGRVITREGARAFAEVCRAHGIRLVPQFQVLGHQSWAGTTFPLLTVYPELDIAPGAFPGNEGIYCREWDPLNPRVNEIVFPLIEEIVEAFEADAIHVGMDEVFLLGHEKSPSTRGKDPAVLFAKVVNEYHAHFVEGHGLEMFMWGDRLIDGAEHPYGSWEASTNGTAAAIDMISTDIVICDWHYEPMAAYTSVPMFLDRGFRVLPSSWRDLDGVERLVKYSYGLERPGMLGHLFTTWRRVPPAELVDYAPLREGLETARAGRFWDVGYELAAVSSAGVLEVELTTTAQEAAIHYTIDGSEPTRTSTRYEGPLRLSRSARVRAIAVAGDRVVSDVTGKRFVVHRATGRPVSLQTPPSSKYPPAGGAAALVNGVTGSVSYADGQWVGLEGGDLEAVIDLEEPVPVTRVAVSSLHDPGSWVFHSRRLEVYGSEDGEIHERLGVATASDSEGPLVPLILDLENVTTRFLKVVVRNRTIPEGHDGAGQGAWLFVDEIEVR